MQFIAHRKKLPMAFANPLEAEGGGTLMMGQYWKRKMAGILAEYKKWRIFYKNQNLSPVRGKCEKTQSSPQGGGGGTDDIALEAMVTDADMFVDAIFNDLESDLFHLTDDWTTMDNADFIQTGLINIKPSEEWSDPPEPSPPVTDLQILQSCDPVALHLHHQEPPRRSPCDLVTLHHQEHPRKSPCDPVTLHHQEHPRRPHCDSLTLHHYEQPRRFQCDPVTLLHQEQPRRSQCDSVTLLQTHDQPKRSHSQLANILKGRHSIK